MTDPHVILASGSRIIRTLQEGFGDFIRAVRSGAAVEPELAVFDARGQEVHRAATRMAAERLGELGALRSGISVEEAADVMAVLTHVDVMARLVNEYG